jgi:hypothetical protein
LDFALQKVDATVSDYQHGFVDGIAKARELVIAAKGRYNSRGMFGTAAQEALEETAQLLETAVQQPMVTR